MIKSDHKSKNIGWIIDTMYVLYVNESQGQDLVLSFLDKLYKANCIKKKVFKYLYNPLKYNKSI